MMSGFKARTSGFSSQVFNLEGSWKPRVGGGGRELVLNPSGLRCWVLSPRMAGWGLRPRMLRILGGVWTHGDLSKPVSSSWRAGTGTQGTGPGPQGECPDRQEAETCREGRGLHLRAARKSLVLREPNLNFEGRGFCPRDLGGGAWALGGGAWASPGGAWAPWIRTEAGAQARGGSGSTLSQMPFSVRRMSSGFRRTLRVRSTLRRKRSSVSATATRISAMAKLCPMQFLEEGGRGWGSGSAAG